MTTPRERLLELADGFIVTQLLHLAARLGLADRLAERPQSGAELAAATGADPALLTRALRGLVLSGVLAEEADGRFGLTETGAALRTDVPGSLHGSLLARGSIYYGAAGSLVPAVLAGDTAFELAYGEPFFAHLEHEPAHAADFQAAMSGRAEREAAAIAAACDLRDARRLVDVGGGRGVVLEALLRANPGLRGLLLDRPPVAAEAGERLRAAGLGDRVTCAGGDMFDAVPADGDVYLLSRVLHDWDDERARAILRSCRAAMGPGTRLLVAEAILPERVADGPAAVRMDLFMLLLFTGARERAAAEFAALLEATGFALRQVVATEGAAVPDVLDAVAV